MAVSKLSPASGANDFNLNIGGLNTTVALTKEYASGSYSIVSSVLDTTIDIYAYAADGSLAGYTSTKAFTATKGFNKMVIIGGTAGDVLGFTYKTTFGTTNTTSEVTAGPFITDITPSSMPNQDNSITITGGNFASDVAVAFTGTGYSSTAAKSIVRSSVSQLIVTRPDNFPVSASPYTVIITNPGVDSPVATNAHIFSNSITAGVVPSWSTSTTLPAFQKSVSYSQSVVATDADGSSSLTYSANSSTLPTGITFSAGAFSGTPSANGGSYTASIRATDSGGNYIDRTFTMTQDKPDAPIIGTATTTGGSTATIAFTVPTYTGTSTITTYTATSSPAGGTGSISQAGSGTINITGLTAVTAYTFTVTATNSSGASLSSSASSSITTLGALADILIVGGGGAGGWYTSGGGGAGGLVYSTGDVLSAGTTYTVTIGGGGPTGGTDNNGGAVGVNSSFGSIYIAAGGGRGGSQHFNSGTSDGGSGGGKGEGSSVALGVSTQVSYGGKGFGSSGGNYTSGPNYGGGGGGGAGAAGSTPSGTTAGVGGIGKQYSTFATATSSGANSGYYAGGGGGTFAYSNSTGAGGLGGGGAGVAGGVGTAGTANTGGGGGGGAGGNASGSGGLGGSGIAIIRTLDTLATATTVGAANSNAPYITGGYKYYKFTGSGTITF